MAFTERVDLAASRVGGAALFATDDFFAPKENLLLATRPVFLEHEYTERGKWMDGWESRRSFGRRPDHSHDSCIIKLGLPGVVQGVDVDTSFFKGNYPDACSVEACECADDLASADVLAKEQW